MGPPAKCTCGHGGGARGRARQRSDFSITRHPSNTSQKGGKGHRKPTHPLILKGSRFQGPEYSVEPQFEWGEMTFAPQELPV